MDLSIIIVNYNTFSLTRDAINSVLKYNYPFNYEIIVVDNNSLDDSLIELKAFFKDKVKFIVSSENKGFAYANNLAIKQSCSEYVLLLNSDTVVEKDTLEKLYFFMEENKDIGACGCQVLLKDGNLDKACKRSFPNVQNAFYRLFHIPLKNDSNNYNLDDLDDDGIYEIDCLTGAFMFIRSVVFESIGFLDETFFMYGEDIDLCYRIKEDGWKIFYYGKSKITHFKGMSSQKKKAKLIYEFYRAMYIYYNKHNKDFNPFYINLIVYSGIILLCIMNLCLNIFKR